MPNPLSTMEEKLLLGDYDMQVGALRQELAKLGADMDKIREELDYLKGRSTFVYALQAHGGSMLGGLFFLIFAAAVAYTGSMLFTRPSPATRFCSGVARTWQANRYSHLDIVLFDPAGGAQKLPKGSCIQLSSYEDTDP